MEYDAGVRHSVEKLEEKNYTRKNSGRPPPLRRVRVLREPPKKAPPPKNPSRPPKPSPRSLSTRLPPLLPKDAMKPEVSALERWQNRLWCQGVGDEEGRRRASLLFSRQRRSKISMTSSQLVDKLRPGTWA